MLHQALCASLALAVVSPAFAADPSLAETERLRQIERRLDTIESRDRSAAPAGKQPTSNAFNPAMSLILDGKLANFSRDPTTFRLPGFALGGESGELSEGLSLGESELAISANIDDKFYGSFTAALTSEDTVEIEEAYIETLALGAGVTARAGRFLSHIGYLNSVHAHAWDFADQPLPYRAMLANNFGDDGVQLRWVAPSDLFVELGAELFRGESFPAGGAPRSGKGANTVFGRVGGDAGVNHAWRFGVSRLTAKALDRATGDEAAPDLFSGNSKTSIVDFVWKWAPSGNAKEGSVKFQAEYFDRDEDGSFDPASAGAPLPYAGRQQGWYAQAVYQFMPRWRTGARYAEIEAGAVDAALAGSVLDNEAHKPKATSVMIDFANSEFSRLRLQYTRDDSRPDGKDNQWYLQYVMSLGPHGAHAF
jgi:hypothetical protein